MYPGPHDPYSPASSAMMSQGGMRTTLSNPRLPLSQRMPSDTAMPRSGPHVGAFEPPAESDEEADDSQLFPGSDLF